MPRLTAELTVFLSELEYLVEVEVFLPVHPDTTIHVDIIWRTYPDLVFMAQLGLEWNIVTGEELGTFRSD